MVFRQKRRLIQSIWGYLFLTADPISWPCQGLPRLRIRSYWSVARIVSALDVFALKGIWMIVVAHFGAVSSERRRVLNGN